MAEQRADVLAIVEAVEDIRRLGVRSRDSCLLQLLDDNRIEFEFNREFYEWTSGDSILSTGGVWNLWVLHDPDYTPFFPTATPKTLQKSQNVLEKLEDRLLTRQGITLLRNFPGRKKSTVVAPPRVMVGGADSMDHLLPKSP